MPTQRTRWPGGGPEHTAEVLRRYHAGERNFRGLYLYGLRLDGAVLRGVDFSDTSLSGDLIGADLREANFTGAEFDHANLSKALLERACFQGANLFQSTLDDAQCQEADFTRATLSEVYLKRADLTDARFVHANLTGDIYLEGARLTGAVFDEANLVDLPFPDGEWPRMSFRGALHGHGRYRPGKGLNLPPGYTYESQGMRLVGPGAALSGLDLRGFRFSGLDLSGADFSGADLRGASFSNVVLKGARFQGANLEGAAFRDLPEGALEGANFSGAQGKLPTGQLAHLAEGNTSSDGSKLLFPSAELAEIVGSQGLSRTDAMKRVHAYVKEHNLSAGRAYLADEKLKRITGKDQVTLIELTKLVNKHLHETRPRNGKGAAE